MGNTKNLEQRTRAIFLICPVRGISPEESKYLAEYVAGLEREGYKVHYPPRDTCQDDPIGLGICRQNREAILNSREVRLFWNTTSDGSRFDLGMSFMAEKPFAIINGNAVVKTIDASFENFLIEFEGRYSSFARHADNNLKDNGNICIISPNDVTLEEGALLEEYTAEHHAYWPELGARTPNTPLFDIYSEQRDAIRNAKEVHVYWSGTMRDDKFGLGMAFMAGKPVRLINNIPPTDGKKSFNNVLRALDEIYRKAQ